MNVLVLVNKPPFPAHDGGAIATLQLVTALAGLRHNLHVFYLNTSKHHYDPRDVPGEVDHNISFYAAEANTSIRWHGAIFSLFGSGTPYIYKRFFNQGALSALRDLIDEHSFDLILFDGLGISVYRPFLEERSARFILRAHNVESEIWDRMSRITPSWLKRIYFNRMAGQIRKFEKKIIHRFQLLIPISRKDAAVFRSWDFRGRIEVLPVGLNVERYATITPGEKGNRILFLGSLEWKPNVQGILWFIREVWPTILRTIPDATLAIAGRRPSKQLTVRSGDRGIQILGEIDDPVSFFHSGTLFIVPLFAGSGIRIKIIEAMAAGCTIVSTSIGAEGLPLEDGKHLLLADDPEQFARQVNRLLTDNNLRKTLGMNGQRLVRESFDTDIITRQLQQIIEIG